LRLSTTSVDVLFVVLAAADLPFAAKARFADLCFAFGIELDDVITEQIAEDKEKKSLSKVTPSLWVPVKYLLQAEIEELLAKADPAKIIFKIDIPANRYFWK
jgi:predicted histidine transporter YuiF (NhaC family)